jgi:cation/acetate symporter
VKVFGFVSPIFPIDPPTIVTMPLAFIACWLVSALDRSTQAAGDRSRFSLQAAKAMGRGALPVK